MNSIYSFFRESLAQLFSIGTSSNIAADTPTTFLPTAAKVNSSSCCCQLHRWLSYQHHSTQPLWHWDWRAVPAEFLHNFSTIPTDFFTRLSALEALQDSRRSLTGRQGHMIVIILTMKPSSLKLIHFDVWFYWTFLHSMESTVDWVKKICRMLISQLTCNRVVGI